MAANPLFMSRLIPLSEVATALGISIYGVRRLIADGLISSIHIGARVMVPSEEVQRIQREGVRRSLRADPK